VETLRQPLETSTPLPPAIIVEVGIDTIVEALVGAGVKIWEAYRDADVEMKQKIIKILNELKWKSFQEI